MDVSVNGVSIPERAIDAEVQYHPAASLAEGRLFAVRALVIRELLLQEARRLGLSIDATDAAQTEDDRLIESLLAAEVEVPTADEASCRRFFEANRDRFTTEPLFEVSHILIGADPNDADARHAARGRARALLARARADTESFAGLAAMHSDCPSKETGGSLGQIGRGQTVPEFERVLHRLQDGELAAHPVESRYGFHLIYLHRRIGGRPLPYEQVADRIARYLDESVSRRAIRQYLSMLIGGAEIRGIDLDGAESPLVQ